jgi:acyl carrier protein
MESELDVLRGYIRDEMAYPGEVDPNRDLLDAQILDSFSIVQLAMFVQERFGVEFDAEDLVRANLATLSSVIALIRRKRGVAADGAGRLAR